MLVPMSTVVLLARIALAAVFAVAAVAKLADLEGSPLGTARFRDPSRPAAALGLLLPLAELAIAVGLLSPAHSAVECSSRGSPAFGVHGRNRGGVGGAVRNLTAIASDRSTRPRPAAEPCPATRCWLSWRCWWSWKVLGPPSIRGSLTAQAPSSSWRARGSSSGWWGNGRSLALAVAPEAPPPRRALFITQSQGGPRGAGSSGRLGRVRTSASTKHSPAGNGIVTLDALRERDKPILLVFASPSCLGLQQTCSRSSPPGSGP